MLIRSLVVLVNYFFAYCQLLALLLIDNDGQPPFANRAMAAAPDGRARLIPLVQRISFGSRLTWGTVAAAVWRNGVTA
jgi:hypothetical protein